MAEADLVRAEPLGGDQRRTGLGLQVELLELPARARPDGARVHDPLGALRHMLHGWLAVALVSIQRKTSLEQPILRHPHTVRADHLRRHTLRGQRLRRSAHCQQHAAGENHPLHLLTPVSAPCRWCRWCHDSSTTALAGAASCFHFRSGKPRPPHLPVRWCRRRPRIRRQSGPT